LPIFALLDWPPMAYSLLLEIVEESSWVEWWCVHNFQLYYFFSSFGNNPCEKNQHWHKHDIKGIHDNTNNNFCLCLLNFSIRCFKRLAHIRFIISTWPRSHLL
jgi:hypothetical protein